MRASVSSSSFVPSRPKNLMPLSWYGLCDAETTAARSSPSRRASTAAPGVGSTPANTASPPAAVIPAASAASNICPDSRVSRTISTCGALDCATLTAACPSRSARSAVRNSPARPRTPSVPNRRRLVTASVPILGWPLALGELRPLAGLLEPRLLALLLARVARQVAAALQLGAQRRLGLDERAGDAVAQRPGLRRHAAAVDARDDVHAREVSGRVERLLRLRLEAIAREVLLERLAVDRVDAGARLQDDAGDRGLALAGRLVARIGRKLERRAQRGGLGLGRSLALLVTLLADRVLRVLVALAFGGGLLEDQVRLQVSPGDDLGLVRLRLGAARRARALGLRCLRVGGLRIGSFRIGSFVRCRRCLGSLCVGSRCLGSLGLGRH